MAWRMVVQPNGCYARWSDVVDDFTAYDMTREEAVELCREELGREDAEQKVLRAEQDLTRFETELDSVRILKGPDKAEIRRRAMSAPRGAAKDF